MSGVKPDSLAVLIVGVRSPTVICLDPLGSYCSDERWPTLVHWAWSSHPLTAPWKALLTKETHGACSLEHTEKGLDQWMNGWGSSECIWPMGGSCSIYPAFNYNKTWGNIRFLDSVSHLTIRLWMIPRGQIDINVLLLTKSLPHCRNVNCWP